MVEVSERARPSTWLVSSGEGLESEKACLVVRSWMEVSKRRTASRMEETYQRNESALKRNRAKAKPHFVVEGVGTEVESNPDFIHLEVFVLQSCRLRWLLSDLVVAGRFLRGG